MDVLFDKGNPGINLEEIKDIRKKYGDKPCSYSCFFSLYTTLLLGFSAIALFVSPFLIVVTPVTVALRTKDMGKDKVKRL